MRASKELKIKNSKFKTQKRKLKEIHISGAEGIYTKKEINSTVRSYIQRALSHSKGIADKIVVTIERLKQEPLSIKSLPVYTLSSSTPAEGERIVKEIAQSLVISKKSAEVALKVIKEGNMRGAAIISARKAERLEHDCERGVRVSLLGISKSALKRLSSELSKHRINTDTVKEAIILASKVASCINTSAPKAKSTKALLGLVSPL